jgi:glycerol-3-phosphate dehydrogenase
VVEGRPETVGELRFAVLAEGARSVADLLDRRTRIGLVGSERALAEPVADAVLAADG